MTVGSQFHVALTTELLRVTDGGGGGHWRRYAGVATWCAPKKHTRRVGVHHGVARIRTRLGIDLGTACRTGWRI